MTTISSGMSFMLSWYKLATSVKLHHPLVLIQCRNFALPPSANMTTIVEQCRKGCDYIIRRFTSSR